jgi:phenylacetate-coenzyme A ligase PaaK-like adenylate-forming protein
MNRRINQTARKFRETLARTERLPPRQLRAYQNDLLNSLIQHARRNVPFYEGRLAPLASGSHLDLSRWDEVPILTRADAQGNTEALTARTLPADAGRVEKGETSGSTGRPVRYLINELATIATLAATDRALRWWNFDGAKTMATFIARSRYRGSPDGVTQVGWRVGSTGLHHMIDISPDNDAQIDWLLARRPHYLTAQAFTLLGLAERVRARGVDLRFERINSMSSVLTDETRRACEEVFGARPIDLYGARETGLIACECPGCRHYHTNAETVLVEILDADGRPSLPGEMGRVVLTPFYNYAMPFIRYEIGDFAVAGPQRIKCAVKLPALTQIIGRYRNSFTLQDGRVISPRVAVDELRKYISFAQYQIVQTAYDAIEVRYVPLDRSHPADAVGLEMCVRASIDASFNVRAVAVDDIPRSASGKFEDYLSLV